MLQASGCRVQGSWLGFHGLGFRAWVGFTDHAHSVGPVSRVDDVFVHGLIAANAF